MREVTIDWETTFLTIAQTISQRSKDPSTQCGAVLVESRTRAILATGFNGPPAQIVDSKVPWRYRPQKYAYIMHAEENALWYAMGSAGFDRIKDSIMFCTHRPCAECAMRMIRCNVKTCVYPHSFAPYPLSKYQVNPEDVIETQKFPQLELIARNDC